MMRGHHKTWLDRLAVVVTALVALAAGVLAASHTVDMVEVTTGTTGLLAWLVPVTIEGGALTAALLAASRHRAELSARFEIAVVLGVLALAVAVNASAASGPWPSEAVVLTATPPLVLALSVHGLVRARAVTHVHAERAEAERRERDERDRREREKAERAAEASVRRATRRERPTPAPKGSSTKPVDARIEEWLAVEPDLTGRQIGERLGVSEATGRRRLAASRARRDQEAA